MAVLPASARGADSRNLDSRVSDSHTEASLPASFRPAEFGSLGNDGGFSGTDAIEEMRLRAWARRNYCAPGDRDAGWHPVVLDEMSRKDRE